VQSPSEQSPVELVRWGPKRRHLVRQRNEQIYARYQDGWSQVEISREFGISQPLVSQILRRSAPQPKSGQHQWTLQAKLVGMTLRNARISASMTQRELACRLGVSDVAVGNWERGSQEIPGNRLAQVYQIRD
jgi:transcriptional regulator with XRE-family HTH domain